MEGVVYEENNRDPRTQEAEVVNQEVNYISREEVKSALRRMKKRSSGWARLVASKSVEVHGKDGDKVFDQTVQ